MDGPLLVVFLRHSGCPFCRQTLSDLAQLKDRFATTGVRLVIVHQDTPERGAAWIAQYDLGNCEQISDPTAELYRQFDLIKTRWWNVAGPRVWWAGFKATLLEGHGIRRIVGDVKQLTGAFLIHRGQIVKSFRQAYSSDRPDYNAMVCEV